MELKIIAAIFAAYEAYKLLHAGAFSALIEQMKEAGHKGEAPQDILKDLFFRRVVLIELAYLLFAVFLIFTPYWYFTIVLMGSSAAVMLSDTKTTPGRLVMVISSAVLALLLMKIVLA